MVGYYKVNFEGYWPVGAGAIVIARDRGHARRLLMNELEKMGLDKKNSDIPLDAFELIPHAIGVHILNDGNY